MIKRTYKLPQTSFFLFGPRGTGKTTWLKEILPDAKWIDLVRNEEYLRYLRNPGLARMEIAALAKGTWIVIDEVQKLPDILNDVHSILTDFPDTYRFALSGSSARKLRRLNANLLPGRTITRNFYPLTAAELSFEMPVDRALSTGCLPKIITEPGSAIDLLDAYVANYLKQEIQQEALVENIGSFARFLEVAALMNARVVNTSNIARDTGVARNTVDRYFDVLEQTLIGTWLPGWQPRAKVKEASRPKFFFFDTGVVRAIQGTTRDRIENAEKGYLLETWILHELRAYQTVSGCGGSFSYWGTPGGSEIDFIWTRGREAVGIEIKSGDTWRSRASDALKGLAENGTITRAFGVYHGPAPLKDGPVTILPVIEFLKRLNDGGVIGYD